MTVSASRCPSRTFRWRRSQSTLRSTTRASASGQTKSESRQVIWRSLRRPELPPDVERERDEPQGAPVEHVLEAERAPHLDERLALILRPVGERPEEAGVHRADRGAAEEVDAGLGSEPSASSPRR